MNLVFQQAKVVQGTCEGGVDVVGVVTPFVRGGAQVLRGDQVVGLSVLLGVHEEGEVEEDSEGQVEVEREEGEMKEKRTWMTVRNMMRLKNTLSHEVHRHQEVQRNCALQCSQIVQLARVGVRVLVVDAVCVMFVLIARVVVHAVNTQFSWPVFCSWRCTLDRTCQSGDPKSAVVVGLPHNSLKSLLH